MSEDKKLCIFCGKGVVLSRDETTTAFLAGFVAETQIVYGGIGISRNGGSYVKKNPGKTIYHHEICDLPEGLCGD